MISLKQFAAAVTKNPPAIKISQFPQSIDGICPLPTCIFCPIKKDIEAENTTVNDSLNLISLEKSEKNCFNSLIIIVCMFLFCKPANTNKTVN